MKTFITTLLLTLSFFSYSAVEFNPAEKKKLTQGSMIKKVIWKKGYVWPEVKIFILLDKTPADNMNAFSHFENHKTYIPDMMESRIIKKVSPEQLHVYFEMKVPWPIKKSTYVTNNVITQDSDGGHTLTWNLVKADMLKSTDGFMKFSPYEGKTLLEYVTFIVPNSSFAGMFKNRVEKDVENSVNKIVNHLNSIQL